MKKTIPLCILKKNNQKVLKANEHKELPYLNTLNYNLYCQINKYYVKIQRNLPEEENKKTSQK